MGGVFIVFLIFLSISILRELEKVIKSREKRIQVVDLNEEERHFLVDGH